VLNHRILNTLAQTLKKHQFWTQIHASQNGVQLNERQKNMLNKLLDGFDGKLTTSKWAKISKCSPDTALRDIQSLLEQGILFKEEAGGRSTSYRLTPS
jgi:Fic family protein